MTNMMQAGVMKWVTLLALAAFAATVVNGCNIVAPAVYFIEGPPKVEAQHILADVPTVVFIDDRSNVFNTFSLRRVIADKFSHRLMMEKVLSRTISPQDTINLARTMERNNQIMSIEEIGKAVGAEQVIYIEMLQFTDTPDGYTPRPMAACQVKVIDITNRKRVFPPEDSDEPARYVRAMTREVDPEMYRTRAGRLQTFEALAITTGEQVAKLFYKHDAKELGGNLTPR